MNSRRTRAAIAALTLGLGALIPAGVALAQSGYTRDAITAIAPGRHQAFPTATCTVWANAEDLGVGPADLDGYHGISFGVNEHPIANDGSGVSFDAGIAAAKKALPKAPAWMFAAIEKNKAAIEAACAKDSENPILIRKLTAKDKG